MRDRRLVALSDFVHNEHLERALGLVDAAFGADLKVLRELCVRLVRSEVGERPRISSWTAYWGSSRLVTAG